MKEIENLKKVIQTTTKGIKYQGRFVSKYTAISILECGQFKIFREETYEIVIL